MATGEEKEKEKEKAYLARGESGDRVAPCQRWAPKRRLREGVSPTFRRGVRGWRRAAPSLGVSFTTMGGKETKNITCPHLQPSQSMKLTKEIGHISTNTLDQDHRFYTKEFFNLWIDNSSLSNTIKFLFFHIVQNIHKGAACQAFLRPLSTNNPCHPRRVSFTEQERIQDTPKREKRRFQRTRVFAQWRKRWSTVSTSERQKKHLFSKKYLLLWSWSNSIPIINLIPWSIPNW